uniref:Solute carrier family 35 member F5 n=1 Tax=Phallusia mammillata TaxID=59560 RepID=A0A6F9DTE4_9ASCI|nr:solute carrier family 35 member F5-like [Phallusia mammillata]
MPVTEDDPTINSQAPTRSKSKFCLGIFLLLLVDILWVASSEASEYLFQDIHFNKPYMSTYIKTSMFSIYLLGFIIFPSWRRQCIRCACDDYPGQYQLIGETDTEDTDTEGGDFQIKDSLGESMYVPANLPSASEIESGDDSEQRKSGNKVKFSNLMEVKHLDVSEADQIARMNYSAAARAKLMCKAREGNLTVQQVLRISSMFAIVFFLGNVAYQEALNVTDMAVVNIMSSMSGVFTLILAGMFPSRPADQFSLTKFLAILVYVGGLVMVSLGAGEQVGNHFVLSNHLLAGIMWSLLGSFCYAVYLVFLQKSVGTTGKLDVPMFFGFVGLVCFSLLWSGMAILHYLRLETFQLPNKTEAILLVVNGLVGTVLSELFWLWGCMFTSSLVGTMALSFNIPLSILVDIIVRKEHFTWLFYIGVIPVFVSFIFVAYLSHKSQGDPIRHWICKCCRCCCCSCRQKKSPLSEQEIPLTLVTRT